MLGLPSFWAPSAISLIQPWSHLDRITTPERREGPGPGLTRSGWDQGSIQLLTEGAQKDESPDITESEDINTPKGGQDPTTTK